MTILSWIQAKIEWFGNFTESALAVAFSAHAWAAFAIITFPREMKLSHRMWLASAVLAFALSKEFFYDLRYETNPTQTLLDSERDFLGYLVGIIAAILMAYIWAH